MFVSLVVLWEVLGVPVLFLACARRDACGQRGEKEREREREWQRRVTKQAVRVDLVLCSGSTEPRRGGVGEGVGSRAVWLVLYHLFEAAKARLLTDGTGGTCSASLESGETAPSMQAARAAAGCLGGCSQSGGVRAIWQSRAGGPLREIEGGVNIDREKRCYRHPDGCQGGEGWPAGLLNSQANWSG